MKMQFQQGDVNITRIDRLPSNLAKPLGAKLAKLLEGGVIREGESTGHAHRIVGTEFRLYQLGQIILGEIVSDDCRIVHEEHKPIDLPVGTYEFSPTVEFDHFANRQSWIRD